MIAQIRGNLIQKSPGSVIVETNGIGYRIFVSLNTFYSLPDSGGMVQMHVHTHVREDLIHLYGFASLREKELFQMLISVSGIGPKLALNILSGISPEELLCSLGSGEVNRLLTIPGVGRKTAERMLVDLQDRAQKIESRLESPRVDHWACAAIAEDVISALINLGYKKGQAEKIVKTVLRETPQATLEETLKASLKMLSAG